MLFATLARAIRLGTATKVVLPHILSTFSKSTAFHTANCQLLRAQLTPELAGHAVHGNWQRLTQRLDVLFWSKSASPAQSLIKAATQSPYTAQLRTLCSQNKANSYARTLRSLSAQRQYQQVCRSQQRPMVLQQSSRASAVTPASFRSMSSYPVWQQFGARAPPKRWWQHLNGEKVLWGLMLSNLAAWFFWRVDPEFMQRNTVVSIQALREGRLHTLVTSCFSQRDAMHLFSNMLGLYFFGRNVAYTFGGSKLLALYLAGGVFGNLCHIGWQYHRINQQGQDIMKEYMYRTAAGALGSSGSVNAIVTLDILLHPTAKILLYGVVPLPAWLLGALYLFNDVTGAITGGGRIAHVAHLGGAAVGAAFYAAYRRGLLRR